MANGFCNLSQNIGQNPCTLCNRAFPSTQALITHVDSHIEHEEGAIRRFYSHQTQNVSHHHLLRPNFPIPTTETHQNINDNGRFFQPPQQPTTMAPPQPRRNQLLHVGSSPAPVIRQMQLPPQLHVLSSARNHQYSPYDGTKAYITQLEKPIKKIDFIDLVDIDDDDAQPLDLTLKL